MIFSTIKNYLILILVIIIALLSIGVTVFYIQNRNLKGEVVSLDAELKTKTGQSVVYTDEDGDEVIQLSQYTKDIQSLKESKDSLELVTSRAISSSNIRNRHLKEALAVALTSSSSGVYDTTYIVLDTNKLDSTKMDTVQVKVFDDGYLRAEIYPDTLSYIYTESFSILKGEEVTDRKFFLWKWVGWKKKTNRDMVQIKSEKEGSSFDGRLIKIDK